MSPKITPAAIRRAHVCSASIIELLEGRTLLSANFIETLPSRADFTAASRGLTKIDFGTFFNPNAQLDTLNAVQKFKGVTFDGALPQGNHSLVLVRPSFFPVYQGFNGNPTVMQGPSENRGIEVTLPAGTTAVGTDFYDIENADNGGGNDSGGVTIELSNGEFLEFNGAAKPKLGFAGITSPTPITSFRIFADNFDFTNLANFTFGSAGSTISGTAFTDTNSDGKRQSGEKGTAGATVFLDTNKNGTLDKGEVHVTANSRGAFTFSDVAPGTYRVTEVPPAGDGVTTFSDVVVKADTTNSALLIGIGKPATASIAGRVFDDVNGNGTRDAGEAGLGLITVYLDLKNDKKLDKGDPSVVTDVLGNFKFTGLAAGTYTLRFLPVAGLTATKPTGGVLTVKLAVGQASNTNLLGVKATS